MYARWGHGPREILAHLMRDPRAALGALWTTPGDAADTLAKRQYWLHLLGPVLGTALLAPLALLPALPVIAEHLLSSRIEQHTVLFQYTALVLPFVAIAAVDAVARLSRGTRPRGPRPCGKPRRRLRGRAVGVRAVCTPAARARAGAHGEAPGRTAATARWLRSANASRTACPRREP